jgi:hypothetical protein
MPNAARASRALHRLGCFGRDRVNTTSRVYLYIYIHFDIHIYIDSDSYICVCSFPYAYHPDTNHHKVQHHSSHTPQAASLPLHPRTASQPSLSQSASRHLLALTIQGQAPVPVSGKQQE